MLWGFLTGAGILLAYEIIVIIIEKRNERRQSH
jgi:hypothetical protein